MPNNFAFGDPSTEPSDFASFSKQDIMADSGDKGLNRLESIPVARNTTPVELADVIGAATAAKAVSAGNMAFHVIGDSGGIHSPQFQQAVSVGMAADLTSSGALFCYHLGDVVYYFGQEQYYYEQFYDVYRGYNAPIFAIAGNHDGVLFSGEQAGTLAAFLDNFCAQTPTHNPDALGAARTRMTQPGVYFTLNTPFVKFIGLYSNVSESASQGVIASPSLGHAQLDFLKQQLAAAKAERAAGKGRALIIATHHPPFTASPDHVPSDKMLDMIDKACSDAGIWPDMHLSGHAHLYERYTRTIQGREIPYVIAGMSGYYNLAGLKPGRTPNSIKPAKGKDATGNPLSLDCYNDNTFGFLSLSASPTTITSRFIGVDTQTGATSVIDSFALDLKQGKVSTVAGKAPGPKKPAPKKGKKK